MRQCVGEEDVGQQQGIIMSVGGLFICCSGSVSSLLFYDG